MKTAAQQLHAADAFVFDFYGTLIDDDASVPPMWRYLNELGYHSHPDLEAAFEPNGFDGCETSTPSEHDDWFRANWRRFLNYSGVPDDAMEATLEAMIERRETFTVQRAPGVAELLALLRTRGVLLGICSNWESAIAPFLEHAELPAFDAVVTSRDCGSRKPHGAIFRRVCDDLGARPENTVFVGDSWWADVVGALRAGLRPVWVRKRRPGRGLDRLVVEVDSIAELEAALRDPPHRLERD